ncbi:hypothetical protein [Methylobacterium trifolii]|uniref:Uncharacterized protein n=1 Tax=Methylobacterium trifolii TaxID=1003092 RepID=A0ABQ4U4K3_9HYPH|nr:hypothetical protein [Methylobacterium trifolii]GJE61767.1 hypothetical protein MPOCJGCO_3893 [Methylobacterium trifolii]
MANVIRPTYGKARPEPSRPISEPIAEYVPLRVHGTAAGFLVALMRDEAGAEGPALEVVAGNSVEAVAAYPAMATTRSTPRRADWLSRGRRRSSRREILKDNVPPQRHPFFSATRL